jgi:hypothetical protein
VKSGITTVSSSVLCILAAVNGGAPAPRLDVPHGYTARMYAQGLEGVSRLDVRADGTLTLDGTHERFEIAPPNADQPVTVMRVAAELDAAHADTAPLSLASPRLVQMRWNSRSGELDYVVLPAADRGVSVTPSTLALARRLANRRHGDVAFGPDGTLYFADSRAGAVWRIERSRL